MFPTLLQIQILHSVLHFEKSDNLLSGFLSGFICPVQLDDGTTSIAKNSRNHHGDRVVAAMRRSCDWWNLKVRHHLSWVILEQQHKTTVRDTQHVLKTATQVFKDKCVASENIIVLFCKSALTETMSCKLSSVFPHDGSTPRPAF